MKITRKITSTTLAWVCVILLGLYAVSAVLVWAYLAPDRHGILAALLAANAGTALFVGLAFNWPEFSHCTSKGLRLIVAFIGVLSGLVAAVSWLADEVDRSWLTVVFISPVFVILLVLIWFDRKATARPRAPRQSRRWFWPWGKG